MLDTTFIPFTLCFIQHVQQTSRMLFCPPKTKHNNTTNVRPMSTPSKTPTKVTETVNITPTAKIKKCIVCSKLEWNPDYRRNLFHGPEKTEVAKKI